MTFGARVLAWIMRGLAIAIATAPAAAWAVDAALVEAAKREGQVVWYTTLIVNQAIRPLQEAFERTYPGIKLQYSRADDSPTVLKILNEARAGHVQADVFDSLYNMVALQRAGLVAPYRPPSFDLYPADVKNKNGYWTALVLYVFAPGVNTNLVPLEQAPKTVADLLDPKWKGKMAWNPSSIAGAPGFVGYILSSLGEERGMQYLQSLSRQQVINVEASSRAILDQVITGEYPMGLMMFNNHTVISARKGAPSAWLKIEPMPVALVAVSLLKDAPHPNAARLLIDFLTSEEAQQVLRQADYLPALPGVPTMTPGLRPADGNFAAVYLHPEVVDQHMPQWTKVVADLFR
jgi:ABC-type Fe3+ transport system substrate-binding protein